MASIEYRILETLERLLILAEAQIGQLSELNATVLRIEVALQVPITGIATRLSGPLNRSKEASMALSTDPVVTSITLLDPSQHLLTVEGTDNGNPPVLSDISLVATVAFSIDNPAIASVTPVVGSNVTAMVQGLTAGSFTLTEVATWADGSQGPYTMTYAGTNAIAPGGKGIITTMSGPM